MRRYQYEQTVTDQLVTIFLLIQFFLMFTGFMAYLERLPCHLPGKWKYVTIGHWVGCKYGGKFAVWMAK